MRYAPPGLCLNDFSTFLDERDGRLHVLHLQAPPFPSDEVELDTAARMETSYGHASTSDFITWTTHAPVFGIGRPGSFDSSAVWTMSLAERAAGADRLSMLYTGIKWLGTRRDEAIGLAVSAAGPEGPWIRHPEAVITPDARWYRTAEDHAWRDPFVVRDETNNQWLAFICARLADTLLETSGCVALATSANLVDWEVHEPVLHPGDTSKMEVPVVYPDGRGGWLLLAGVDGHRIAAWTSPSLRGPWTGHGEIGPTGPYSARVVEHIGDRGLERLMLSVDERRSGLSDDGMPCRGVISVPKLLVLDDGPPRLTWWPGLDTVAGAPTDEQVRNGIVRAVLPAGARSMVVQARAGGPDPAVVVTITGDEVSVTSEGRVLQAVTSPVAGAGVSPVQVTVLLDGEFVEVYLDGLVAIVTTSYASTTGSASAVLDDGRRVPVEVRPIDLVSARDDYGVVL